MTVTAFSGVRPAEPLGYGTLVVLDGAFAARGRLEDEAATAGVLRRMAGLVEPASAAGSSVVAVGLHDADGHSAALVDGETCAVAHVFLPTRTVTVRLFSPRGVPIDQVTAAFREVFLVGRFQSAVRDHATLLPRDEPGLRRHLAGDRAYARLRLAPEDAATPVP